MYRVYTFFSSKGGWYADEWGWEFDVTCLEDLKSNLMQVSARLTKPAEEKENAEQIHPTEGVLELFWDGDWHPVAQLFGPDKKAEFGVILEPEEDFESLILLPVQAKALAEYVENCDIEEAADEFLDMVARDESRFAGSTYGQFVAAFEANGSFFDQARDSLSDYDWLDGKLSRYLSDDLKEWAWFPGEDFCADFKTAQVRKLLLRIRHHLLKNSSLTI